MEQKYLLYIDILGFGDLVTGSPEKVKCIYEILDSLNVHQHNVFNTVVFSDTVLVYNNEAPKRREDHDYIVWYSIEFAEDLHHRLTGQDIYFRAVLVHGSFNHYRLKNVECFYGKALIDAYNREKRIPSIGLFIDTQCNKHNKYFRTAMFNDELNFVYLNRTLESFYHENGSDLPVKGLYIDDRYPDLACEVRFLKDIYKRMREDNDPAVRVKFLTAWDFYMRRYPKLLRQLDTNSFDLKTLSKDYDWSTQLKVIEENIKYHRNLCNKA